MTSLTIIDRESSIDAQQRETALDQSRSFIVQAPAGSGKTSLLVQRYLALLATVNSPEEIIAITFTRKAATEMQNRILAALEQTTTKSAVKTQLGNKTIALANKVLDKDRAEQWNLLNNPRRLRIQTIDALCSYLAYRVPISSGIDGHSEIAQGENVEKYYHLAVENLLQEQQNAKEIQNVLLHLDNDREYFVELGCQMLKKRDQWLPHIIGVKHHQPDQLRHILEQGLQNSLAEILEKCQLSFPQKLLAEIDCLINFAISNLKSDHNFTNFNAFFSDKKLSQNINHINIWLELSNFLLTDQGEWRKAITTNQGFPSQKEAKNKEEKQVFAEMKNRMKELLSQLGQCETFHQNLLELQSAPSPTYSDSQWQVLYSLLETLPLLVAHLKLIFQAEGAADYTEISMAADRALGYSDSPTELALNLDYRIKHLLIDEFQDTSLAQYRLIEKLTAGWENNDGRTLFLVGDPMQSIYRFRQAEVGLFLRAQNEGIGNITLQPLQLTANFRSHAAIINWLNVNFPHILPSYADITVGSIPFTPCEARAKNDEDENAEKNFNRVDIKVLANGTPKNEAHCISGKIKHILQFDPKSTIAILLQTRNHAQHILTALKNAKIPYRAVELESLKNSIIIQDLFALTRALSDPVDKVAWLAILRAPWCGLCLNDLYVIANHHSSIMWQNICAYQSISPQLSSDGIVRIKRFIQAITPSLQNREYNNLRDWIEETWLRLGGPACYEYNFTLEDAERYLTLLEQHSLNNLDTALDTIKQQLENLYLSTNIENAQVQIMTIHKAKGLEFDHVIVAGLDRKPQSDKHQLLLWLERPRLHRGSDLLLAPIKEASEQENKIYSHLKAIEQKKSYNEISRLLYVAATRAKKSLHFFACLDSGDNGEEKTPAKGSLLERLWHCSNQHEHWLEQKYNDKISIQEDKTVVDKICLSRLSSDWDTILANGLPTPFLEYLDRGKSFVNNSVKKPINNCNSNNQKLNNPYFKHNFTLPDDARARMGTVIHQCLQKFAHDIEQNYHNFTDLVQYIASQQIIWKKLLIQAGFYHDFEIHLKKIALALKNTQKDQIGKWILSREHREARNEYAITTVVNNEIRHLVIDRTFIDKDNKRWIVDYKTSAPNGIELAQFFEQEQEKYQPQLELYALAFSKTEDRPIWLGLYFPLCQGWINWQYKIL